jgi:glutathione S-transferase
MIKQQVSVQGAGIVAEGIQLVIGNRNYSSWSLRAWLPLARSGVEFETVLLPLDTSEFADRIGEYSPTGRVPVLWHEGQCVWDSLAIGEYINEEFAGGALWPQDASSRALGRSMAAEMHSGFSTLRSRMPMNCRARGRTVAFDGLLDADLQRLWTLWSDSLDRHHDHGPWLLGQYSLADAMFAPVVLRLGTYGIEPPADLQPYCNTVLSDEILAAWLDLALQETWVVEADEAGV